MKKLSKIYILIIFLAFLFQGCTGAEKNEFLNASRMLAEIQTYSVTAEIIVQGNKMTESYVVRQYFKYPDKYRLEVISPDDKKGKTTVYDGSCLWIYHPQINQMFKLDNLKEVEETGMFPGYFAGSLFMGEEASYSIVNADDGEYIAIKTIMQENNNYRKHQVLYMDRKSYKPVKMEVYDSSENKVVTVYYRDFLYNVKLDDNLFRGDNLQG